MANDDAAPTGGRPKSPVDQWFELFVYAPLGFALDARQLLPRFIDRGRSQVKLARVVGRYAVRRGSARAGGYLEQSGAQATALLQAFGLLGDEPADRVEQSDLDDFEGEVINFERPAPSPTAPSPTATASPTAAPSGEAGVPDATTLAIPDYDNLSASQVVPRLGGLSAGELDAVHRYESANRGRKTILHKIAQLRSA